MGEFGNVGAMRGLETLGSHGTEVVRSDWSRSVKVGSVMVGQVRSLAWQVISQINRKGNQRNGSF